jgi:ATP-dependent 26S proteasome regulatory subunit
MTLANDVNLEELIMSKDDLSGADVKVKWFIKKNSF